MKTAVDTNVFSRLWSAGTERVQASGLLAQAQEQGSVLIGPVVFAEMLAHPLIPEEHVRLFLRETNVQVRFEMPEPVWVEAGRRFARYSQRRKQSGGGEPRRLLADFVVGAHALLQADRLLTFDVGRYRIDFPELVLMSAG